MNNGNPLLSVCCITYNHKDYIEDALKSFITQKTQYPFEVVVHDDASTDGTIDIILKYAEKYPGLIVPVIEKENTYSRGIKPILRCKEFTKGKYLAFCEGDDYWSDDSKIEKQISFLESHSDYTCCTHNTLVKNLKSGSDSLMNQTETKSCDISIDRILLWEKHLCFHESSMVIRKSSLDDIPDFYYCITTFEDFPLSLLLASQGKIRYINETMSTYRYFAKGSWSLQNDKDKNRMVNYYKELIDMYKSFDIYSCNKYHKQIKENIINDKRSLIKIRLKSIL